MGAKFYVIDINIHRKRFEGILDLSMLTYINKVWRYILDLFMVTYIQQSVLERFNIKIC